MAPWMSLLCVLVLASSACATQPECACKRPPPNTLSPTEVKAFKGEAATPANIAEAANDPPISPEKAQSMRHGGALYLEEGAKLQAHVGQRIIVIGVAGDAKLGAVVDSPLGVLYLSDTASWNGDILGQDVEVSGVLERRNTASSRGPDGLVTQGTSGPTWWLAKPQYHLLTLDH